MKPGLGLCHQQVPLSQISQIITINTIRPPQPANLLINISDALVRNLTFLKLGISLSLSLSLGPLEREEFEASALLWAVECPGQLSITPNISHVTFLCTSEPLTSDSDRTGPIIWKPYFQHDYQAFRANNFAKILLQIYKR